MTVGLPLIRIVLTPLSILLPLGLSAGMSAADETIQKSFMDQVILWRHYRIDNLKWRDGRYNEKAKSLEESGTSKKN